MIPSNLFALVAALSSFVAVNGAVIQRDGTFTYLTPQPTAPGQAASTTTATTSSQLSSTTATQSTTSTTVSATATTTTQSSSVTLTQSTTPTSTGTTTSATVTSPTTPATTTQSSSATSTPSTTPTVITKTATSTPSTTPTVVTKTTASTPSTTPTVITKTATSTPSTTPTVITKTSTPTVSSPSATPKPPSGTANCNGIQQWQASFAYTAGDQVIFNGQLFTARQWTYNNAPPAHSDQWSADGTCSQPINNQANCRGVPAWQSTVAYTAGNQVTFNDHLWSAVQWSESNSPGDTSGSWQDQGACA